MSSNPALPTPDGDVPSWPRRTPKACASCRRDKIRCDGSRPCGGCHKKGFTADQCVEGCEPCRRARVRCEGGTPCLRCREMKSECTVSPVLGLQIQIPPPTLAVPSPALRRQDSSPSVVNSSAPAFTPVRSGDRAKLACSNCRRDNKKCDDQRPCSRCVARAKSCVHLPRGPKLIKLRCEVCRSHNKRCEEARPCQYCSEIGETCVTATRKGKGHGVRVKAACVACRRDKIRCGGDRPCASCIKKGCECVERPCQMCADAGRGTECVHPKESDFNEAEGDERDQGSRTSDMEGTSRMGQFHTFRDVSVMVNGHMVPRWESRTPGPYSHPLHPLEPTTVPQAQYYFPPRIPHDPTSPPFPMSLDTVSLHQESFMRPWHHYPLDGHRPYSYEGPSNSRGPSSSYPQGPDDFR